MSRNSANKAKVCAYNMFLNSQSPFLPTAPDVTPPRATTQALFQQQFPAVNAQAPKPSYKKAPPTFPSVPTEFSEDFPAPVVHHIPK